MPNTGFLGWAYISGSTISFDSGVADKQVLFMSGSSVVSGASNFQFDYDTSTLSGTHIVPVATDTYDIGKENLVFRNMYATEFYGDLDGAIRFTARNDEGDTITRGQVVYIKGIQGQTPTVALAACDDPAKMPAFGLAASTAADGENLQIISFGNIRNLNLSSVYGGSFSVGDVLYVATGSGGTSGSLTNNIPTGSGNLLQNMAKVVRNGGGGDGQLRVGGAGRTNATPNLDKGYIFIGNDTDQSVQDNTIFVSSSANKVGINETNPQYELHVSGAVSASTYHGDGSNLSGISASPGGSNTQIQFNNGGAFGGDAFLTYNATTDILSAKTISTQNITASGVACLFQSGLLVQGSLTSSGHTLLGSGVTNSDITVDGFLENVSSAGARSYRLFIERQNIAENISYGEYLYNFSVVGTIGESTLGYIGPSGDIGVLTASVTGSGIESLLGFVAGNNAADGFLIRGYCRPADNLLSSSAGTGSLAVGTQVYASPTTPGGYTTVKPTTAGHCVRVVGHSVSTNIIFFNPSPDFIEL